MRNVAVVKPHLFRGARHWWCLQNGMRIGSGYTPLDAYDDWLLKNLAAKAYAAASVRLFTHGAARR